METRRLLTAVSCVAVLGVLLASCTAAITPDPTPSGAPTKAVAAGSPSAKGALPTPSPKASAEEPRYGGILTQGLGNDPPSLDLHQETAGSAQYVVAPAYNGLMRYDPHNPYTIIPDLAKSWDIAKDGLTYTFHLQKGVKWHDGQPFTSEDAKFSFDRMRDPPRGTVSPRRATLAVIDKTETPDPETVVLKLKFPSPSLFANLGIGFMVIFPKHVVEQKGNMKSTMVGTGPFKFKGWDRGVALEIVRNRDYFVQGRPYLDGMTGYIVPDPATRIAGLRTKRILFTPMVYAPSAPQKKTLQASEPNIVLQNWSGLNSNELIFNTQRKPWDDRRVRQAVSMFTDRYAALQVIDEGEGDIGGYMEPSGPWALPKEELLKLPGYGRDKVQDIAKAKQLLAEAGLASGFKTTMLVRQSPKRYLDTATFMKSELAKIGIEADIKIEQIVTFQEKQMRGDFDLISFVMAIAIDDPDARLSVTYAPDGDRNYGKYLNPRIGELDAQQTRELDPAKRKQTVLEMQRILHEDVPGAILYWPSARIAFWKEVRNYANGPGYQNNNRLEDVWLAK